MDQVMQLLQRDEFREQVKYLSPPMKAAFIDAVLTLFEQETETMLDVIEESRFVLTGSIADYEDELEDLRAESRMLENIRIDGGGRRPKSRTNSRNSSSLSYINECDSNRRDDRYGRNRRREEERSDSRTSTRTLEVPYQDRRPGSPSRKRSPSPFGRSRVTPAPQLSDKDLERETDNIMKNLNSADAKIETERQRQERLFHERRERRKREQEEKTKKALELLQKMVAMDQQMKKDRESQDQKVKERVMEMKRRKQVREDTELYDIENTEL